MQPSFSGFARMLAAIGQAMIIYRHMTHSSVVVESVTVLSYRTLSYGLGSWHIEVEGVEISVWDNIPVVAPTSTAQALQVA